MSGRLRKFARDIAARTWNISTHYENIIVNLRTGCRWAWSRYAQDNKESRKTEPQN